MSSSAFARRRYSAGSRIPMVGQTPPATIESQEGAGASLGILAQYLKSERGLADQDIVEILKLPRRGHIPAVNLERVPRHGRRGAAILMPCNKIAPLLGEKRGVPAGDCRIGNVDFHLWAIMRLTEGRALAADHVRVALL